MLVHLIKLVWKRRGGKLLLAAEIFVAFLVVFGLSANLLQLLVFHNQPLGFSYEGVWGVSAQRPEPRQYAQLTAEDASLLEELRYEIEQLPGVETVALSTNRPYGFSEMIEEVTDDGEREFSVRTVRATGELGEVLQLELSAGRWLENADALLDPQPIVVDESLARLVWNEADPLGKELRGTEPEGPRYRVVGVLRAYRHKGEFNPGGPIFFSPTRVAEGVFAPDELLLRVSPATAAVFEQVLEERLQELAPDWSFELAPLARERQRRRTSMMIPLLLGGILATFLLLMVVLGVTGVLWQNVTRRTREMGLRRALGATRGSIHRQVVGEVLVLSSFAVLAGSLLAAQVPLIGLFTYLSVPVILSAIGLSAALMLALAAVAGFYPGYAATRIQPADALHFE